MRPSQLLPLLLLAALRTQAVMFDRDLKYFEAPARVYANARVAIVNDVEKYFPGALHRVDRSEREALKSLKAFLYTGGAHLKGLPGCSNQTYVNISNYEVAFYVSAPLPAAVSAAPRFSLEWISAVRGANLRCLPARDHWKTFVLVEGHLVGTVGGAPFAEPFSKRAAAALYERHMAAAHSLRFQPVPADPRAPVPFPIIFDMGVAVIKDRLFTVGGFYEAHHAILRRVTEFDLEQSLDPLKEFGLDVVFPVAGSAYATDGERYIYMAGGQRYAGCKNATEVVYRVDTLTSTVLRLPDLPRVLMYGRMVYLRASRTLHLVGGRRPMKPSAGGAAHFILQLPMEDAAVDQWAEHHREGRRPWRWREGPALPDSSRLHHTAVALRGADGKEDLYVLGGTEDYPTTPLQSSKDEPNDRGCMPVAGVSTLASVYRYRHSAHGHSHLPGEWERGLDLPIAVSHADAAVVPVLGGRGVLIFGGQTTMLRQVHNNRRSTGNKYPSPLRHIILYAPSLGISKVVGYLPGWFRGEGARALLAVRERVPSAGGGSAQGGILLLTGDSSRPLNSMAAVPSIGKDAVRVSLQLLYKGNLLDTIGQPQSYPNQQ